MEHLSSCYFCGTALDDPLGEYPVVPAQLRETDDPRTTATLCPTCLRKLETVLSAVVGATGEHSVTLEPVTDDRPRSGTVAADDDAEADDDAGITADEVAAMAGDLDSRIVDEGAPTGAERDEPDGVDGGDSAKTASEGEGSAGEHADEHADDDPTAASREPSDAGTDEPPEPATDDADPLGSASPESGAETDDTDGQPDATRTESTSTATESDGPTSDDDSGNTSRTEVSALEYNKVMRLLQNRQFPVDREEIEVVAANAYDLSRKECAQVIDLAVDRGLIAESGDRLVRPD
jgi:hypothetical protein